MDLNEIRRIAGIVVAETEVDKIVEYADTDDEDDELTPAEKELAKMGKGLSKQEEKKLAKADKKDEDKAVKKTKAEVEESLAYYRLNAGMPSSEIIIEGEKDADVYMVITEAKGGFGDAPTLKDIQIFKDAVSAKAFVAKMKGAVKSAQVIGKKFAQVKAGK